MESFQHYPKFIVNQILCNWQRMFNFQRRIIGPNIHNNQDRCFEIC